MTIRKVAGPGRPRGRRVSGAEASRRHRERMKQKGIVELRGLRTSESELAVIDQLVDALQYGSRCEMIVGELLKLGLTHGIVPVRKSA